jgi:hypothetical protein
MLTHVRGVHPFLPSYPANGSARSAAPFAGDDNVEHIAREHLTYPKCQSLISVTRSMKVRTFADNSRDVG